jgi:SAM-dependent methyltransferase
MKASRPIPSAPGPSSLLPKVADLLRCLDCSAALSGLDRCPGCGRPYPESGGIVSAIGPLTGRNRVACTFYDGPGWARFRPWERLFLRVQGGEARARRQILRHLPSHPSARVLEVGIGDGANMPLVAPGWIAYGVDLAMTPLGDCLIREPGMSGRLARAEAEALPFDDGTFDACWSIGGFNYFRDHAAALLEMKRVTRPGGTLIVADEIPHLHRYGIGHLVGFPSIDAFWLRALGLDREFVSMVLSTELDVDLVVGEHWPGAVRHSIWGGLGYCFVHSVPEPLTESPDRSNLP